MDTLPIGASRIGGVPDVPPDFSWPRYKGSPLSYIAQLQLEEVPFGMIDLPLPPRGSLLFFYDSEQRTWGFDPQDRGSALVFFTELPPDKLIRTKAPTDTPEMGLFDCCRIEFEPSMNLPDAWSIHYQPELSDSERDKLFEYFAAYHSKSIGPNHRIGGHADCVQTPMELECQLVTHGLYCGNSTGYEEPRRASLEETAKDWKLLLQIDSDDAASMMWGDVGTIYFWILEGDLRDSKFEHAWLILQCG
ncbi:YwqG family protein [Pirellula sp. SH-Sr6A]|uniref:YwqG family protein n=1 Tax=Pirellula sp. SH-Sr6A TaxID=1632865 RepID=UPI001F0A7D00|nr:YwqG family protein [Pirellula sp. SH-Sr6A]